MNLRTTLIVMSLLSITLFVTHLADDIVRGYEPGTFTNLSAILIYVFWMYGTLVLSGRLGGYIITLLGGLFSLVVPLAHMRPGGKGVGLAATRLAGTDGHFWFVWTLFAIGVTGLFAAILSVHGLWGLRVARRAAKAVG